MKFKQKIIKVGNSFGIVIPKIVMDNMDLNSDDKILIEIIEKVEKIKRYRCLKCGHIFCTEDLMPYCPACSCTDLEPEMEE